LLAEAHISILNAKIYMLLHSKQLKIMKSVDSQIKCSTLLHNG